MVLITCAHLNAANANSHKSLGTNRRLKVNAFLHCHYHDCFRFPRTYRKGFLRSQPQLDGLVETHTYIRSAVVLLDWLLHSHC